MQYVQAVNLTQNPHNPMQMSLAFCSCWWHWMYADSSDTNDAFVYLGNKDKRNSSISELVAIFNFSTSFITSISNSLKFWEIPVS